jgi:hypothetical protein
MERNEKIINPAMLPLISTNWEQAQEERMKQKYTQGRLKYVDMNAIRTAKKVRFGSIIVNSAKAKVLFDPSASHSFISAKYVENQKIMKIPSRKPLIIHTPGGALKAEYVCPEVSVLMNGRDFRENLNVLELTEIDLILGNGWFSAHKGLIQYDRRSVFVTTPSGERIEYKGIPPSPKEHEPGPLKDDGSKTQVVQDQCQCCKHYGVPCLQTKSNKEEVKVNLDYETNKDKKRKAISLEPSWVGSQQLNSTTMPHPAPHSSQTKLDN